MQKINRKTLLIKKSELNQKELHYYMDKKVIQEFNYLFNEITEKYNLNRKQLREKIVNGCKVFNEYRISRHDVKLLCRHDKAKLYYIVPIGCIVIAEYIWEKFNDVAINYKKTFDYLFTVLGKTIRATDLFEMIYEYRPTINRNIEKRIKEEKIIIERIKEDRNRVEGKTR